MGGGDAPSGHQEVPAPSGNQAAVGNGVVLAVLEKIVAGAGALGIVNVNVVVAADHAVLKFGAGHQIPLSQDVLALDHLAFSDADFHGGG